MPFSILGRNAMLDAFGTLAVFASLHDAIPGENGANEFSGGSPAYARKAISWNPAADGNKDASNQPVFDVPAGKTVAHIGFWTAEEGGVWKGSAPLVNEVFAAQGKYTLLNMGIGIQNA